MGSVDTVLLGECLPIADESHRGLDLQAQAVNVVQMPRTTLFGLMMH